MHNSMVFGDRPEQSASITPQAQMLGETLVLTLPSLPSGKLLYIEPTDGADLTTLLANGLFGGDRDTVSVTMLLSPGI